MSTNQTINKTQLSNKSLSLSDSMTITPLGGGQEVGRSCIIVQFKGRNIMLDCGSHPGIEGNGSLPFFDSLEDPALIDMILITHFHIDHCAALPYFTEKTHFKGRIYMTHATKAVMKLLLSDNIKLQLKSKPLYNESDLEKCIDKIEVIDYYQTIEYKGVKFTATKAGHVLGACMFTIDIDGIRILYTGDYSMDEDRHLPSADIPDGPAPDILIVESTFGTTTLSSREDREDKFTRTVEKIVSQRGSCLIPVFALGRAQELLLILEDMWKNSIALQSVPVYYASKLANKALKIYQTFVNMMNRQIQQSMDVSGNPFQLQHIQRVQAQDFDSMLGLGPCVVMASPGFLQSGVSRQLFERWCDDSKNGVIIAGYTVEGTLAHSLLSNPTEVICLDNRKKPIKCLIEHISFSAHVDYTHNLSFIKQVQPNNIILVHGERTQMLNLKRRLDYEIKSDSWSSSNNSRKPLVVTPANGQAIIFKFPRKVTADVIGDIAENIISTISSNNTTTLPNNSILVTENFTSKVVSIDQLDLYTNCKPLRIKQKIVIPIPVELVIYCNNQNDELYSYLIPFLEDIFDLIIYNQSIDITIQQTININLSINPSKSNSNNMYIVEWIASPINDMLADSVVGVILQAVSTTSLLRTTQLAIPTHINERLNRKTKSLIKKESDLDNYISKRVK